MRVPVARAVGCAADHQFAARHLHLDMDVEDVPGLVLAMQEFDGHPTADQVPETVLKLSTWSRISASAWPEGGTPWNTISRGLSIIICDINRAASAKRDNLTN
jgi:hypothetical protein